MEEPLLAKQLNDARVTKFFARNIVTQKAEKVPNCRPGLGFKCDIEEKKTSRWNDLKISSYLLGNAVRSSLSSNSDAQIKLVKKAAKSVRLLREALETSNAAEAEESYLAAKGAFARYAAMVDLPPLTLAAYDHPWDAKG
eukprot:TRINITY_DN29792_c0_g1_i3.p1 TRINITY_DN29792_c0_g1~~TRINITY_DN29792_c0_g1_i3.p1  ORF type:complete len:140 (+),score=31.49 TRINITY_DN29792_c0_g1_i3:251-670(+)